MVSKKTGFDITTLIHSLVNWNEPRSSTAISATQLVKNLPEKEFFRAQVEIVKAVSRINEDPTIKLKELISTLLYVDERAHNIHLKLSSEYLQGLPNSKSFLPVILAYQHEFSKAYLFALQRYVESRASNMDDEIKQVALRGLLHFTRQVFWDAQRYIETEGQVWKHCYRFYHYFEKLKITQEPIQLYQSDSTVATAEQLLLSACMLDLAQPCHLEANEIYAVDRLTSLLVVQQHISSEPNQPSPAYVVNLDSSLPPKTMRRNMVGNRFRYFSTQAIVATFTELKQQLETEIPSLLQQTNVAFSIPQWKALLAKLEEQWLFDGKNSRRTLERVFASFGVKVAIGFKQIAFQSKMSDERSAEDTVHKWKVTDASDDGYSLSYEGSEGQSLRLGNLLLIQPDDDAPSLCVIKQLVKQADNRAKVGVKILGKAPVGVTLSDVNANETEPVNALYITQSNSTDKKRWFLLPTDYAKIGGEAILTVQGKSYQIRLKAPFVDMDGCVNSDFDTLSRVE